MTDLNKVFSNLLAKFSGENLKAIADRLADNYDDAVDDFITSRGSTNQKAVTDFADTKPKGIVDEFLVPKPITALGDGDDIADKIAVEIVREFDYDI